MADGILLQDGTGSLLLQDNSELLLQLQVAVVGEPFEFDVSISTLLSSTVGMTGTFSADANMGNTSQQSAETTVTLSADSAFSGGVEKGAEL